MKLRCPYCAHSIKFDAERESVYCPTVDPNDGIRVEDGFCPNCERFNVVFSSGHYVERGSYASLSRVDHSEIIYPKTSTREPLPTEVPAEYREDFEEAASVLPISPKASAAISRRLLQHLLREKFNIQAPSLAKEIDAFITRPDVPSHLSGAVDAVRNVGNFAAHPLKDTNTGSIANVEPGEAEWLLEVLEALFDFCLYTANSIGRAETTA